MTALTDAQKAALWDKVESEFGHAYRTGEHIDGGCAVDTICTLLWEADCERNKTGRICKNDKKDAELKALLARCKPATDEELYEQAKSFARAEAGFSDADEARERAEYRTKHHD